MHSDVLFFQVCLCHSLNSTSFLHVLWNWTAISSKQLQLHFHSLQGHWNPQLSSPSVINPEHCKEGLLYSQLLWLRCLYPDEMDFWERVCEMASFFQWRGCTHVLCLKRACQGSFDSYLPSPKQQNHMNDLIKWPRSQREFFLNHQWSPMPR